MSKRLLIVVFFLLVPPLFAQDEAMIRGTVVDSNKIILPGATVRLQKNGANSELTTYANSEGKFEFSNLQRGAYTITAELGGFETVTAEIILEASIVRSIQIILPQSQSVSENVTVSGDASSDLLQKEETQHKQELGEQVLNYVPIANQRFQDVLPLVPSVVRGPDGLININGARATESALLVNGSNVTDPVTGNFAIELPIEAIESVQVYTNPYSAEYGKFSGGVTNVSTKGGEDHFKFELNDIIPRLHFSDGKTQGVEAWTPRFRVSGPTMFQKVTFSQAIQYKLDRTFLRDLPEDANAIELRGLDSLTQFDYRPTDKHQMTFTISLFPQELKNVNLNTFLPEESTPDFKQTGYNIAAYDRYFFKNGSFLESSFSVKAYDVTVRPKDRLFQDDPFLITTEGARGRYFNFQDRDSTRFQFAEAYTFRPLFWQGAHVFRAGVEVGRTRYSGQISYSPVEVRLADGTLAERIDFEGDGDIGHSSSEISNYLQDHWSPAAELTVDVGLRMDYDSISGDANLGPRLAIAYSPKALPRTVFKSGFGFFYDKVYLNAADFERYPSRRISQYDEQGDLLSSQRLVNRLAGDIKTPRSTTWNAEVDQQITSRLLIRSDFLVRRGRNQFLLTPLENELLLNNEGRSRYWEWELTSQYRLSKESNLYFSYVRSSTRGDSNDFDTYLGNFQRPIIRENAFANLPFHTPNRFLFWGIVRAPYKFYVSPLLEVRNGFPYSRINEAQQYVGERNNLRFPVFAQLDLRITRTFTVFNKYKVTAGMKVFNVLNHFNPRDVQNNIDSPAFGTFYNTLRRTFRGAFEIQY